MKRPLINFSWPATLSDFSADEKQGNFTRGKLKVFYKGETADHRYFSDNFSEEVIKTLPYTPVVSHYDAEKDDFVGHATEQNIYGIVDPCVEPSFEIDEEGKSWCVCDVVLYTERPDSTGDIAQKIVGHKQSLELDPKTVKYTINYDERRHFKNIEFTAGTFVGVSVLGSDQQPAFTGSEFFSYNEEFAKKMELLKNYCEHKNDQKSGGDEMNLQEFMKLSWGDISSKVDEALMLEYGKEAYTYIIDMFEDSTIVRWYSYIDGTCKLMRVKYSIDDNAVVTLGEVNEVRIAYEDIKQDANEEGTGVQQASLEATDTNAEVVTSLAEDEVGDSDSHEDFEEDSDNSHECSAENSDDPENAKEFVSEANGSENHPAQSTVDNAEVTHTTLETSVDNETNPAQEAGASSTSFTESERAELENLKREKKVNLLNSYKELLSDDEYSSFSLRVDESTYESLELDLLKIYKERAAKPQKQERVFSFSPFLSNTKKETDSLDNWVKKNL